MNRFITAVFDSAQTDAAIFSAQTKVSERCRTGRSRSVSIAIILFILCSTSSYSQIPAGYKLVKDTTSFKQKMDEQSKQINSIESDFTQEKYLSVMSEKIISKGHFHFKKTNMLRWEYTTPYKYIIAINGDKMFIKDNGKVSKYDINSNKMFKSINEMMLNTVQGNLLKSKDYKAKIYENENYFLIELSPTQKGAKDFLKVIQLYINKTDYAVTTVKMIEPSDDYTSIDFSNRKINQPIANEKFIIK